MKRFRHLLFPLFAFLSLAGVSVAADLNFSGKNDSFDHPTVVTGFDPTTGSLTGIISFLRTAPRQTDMQNSLQRRCRQQKLVETAVFRRRR